MNQNDRAKVSVFIICCDEERQIERCLRSVSWCDEIIVIDSGSKDRTVEISRQFTPNVHFKKWEGYLEQKRYGLSLCSYEWVLNVDADEEVSSELRDELLGILAADRAGKVRANGFRLKRAVFFLNRWWRKGGWHPEYRLRLCRRNATTWGGEDPHEKAIVSGTVLKCSGEIFHYSFTDLTDFVRRSNTLSSNSCASLMRRGASFSLTDILIRPAIRFFKFYVLKRGYREGIAGLVVALIEANSAMLKYAKLWEAREELSPKEPPHPR